jgi:hypothetical protein
VNAISTTSVGIAGNCGHGPKIGDRVPKNKILSPPRYCRLCCPVPSCRGAASRIRRRSSREVIGARAGGILCRGNPARGPAAVPGCRPGNPPALRPAARVAHRKGAWLAPSPTGRGEWAGRPESGTDGDKSPGGRVGRAHFRSSQRAPHGCNRRARHPRRLAPRASECRSSRGPALARGNETHVRKRRKAIAILRPRFIAEDHADLDRPNHLVRGRFAA